MSAGSPSAGVGVRIGAVVPAATQEEVAAIVAAIEMTWPRPAVAPPPAEASPWRFSGRPWRRTTSWPRRTY